MKKVTTALLLITLLALLITAPLGCASKYTLSVSSNPTTGGTVAPGSGKYDKDVVVDLVATPASGYRFDHWEGSASGTSLTAHVAMNAGKTVVAYFTKTYGLSLSSTPTGGGDVSSSNGTYDVNTQVTVTASAATGYRFDHWEGSAVGTSRTVTVTMDADKTLTAHFVKTYTISASRTPTGGGTVSPSTGTYDEGESVTLAATPSQYYRFNGWSGDASGASDHVTIIMNSDRTVIASFVKLTYTVQGQVDGSVGGTVDPASATFEAGTNASLTATPAAGYRFDHWGGSATGTSNPIEVFVDSDKTVTAYFVKTYTLTVSGSPNGSCTVDPTSGVYDTGTQVTVSATALFPYAFDHWIGTDANTVNPTTVTMNADKSVTAYFTELSPGDPQSVSVHLAGYDYRIPIVLGAGQWVQGAFVKIGYDPVGISVRILDPASATMGPDVDPQSFTFQAAHGAGTYYVDIYKSYFFATTDYTFNYTIYS